MKKGFTLIELLAVIVILAIIALIATPIILGIISNAKEESNKRSVELYISAVELAIARKNLTEEFSPIECTITKGVVNCKGYSNPLQVDVDGDVPVSGTIKFDNNKTTTGTELTFKGFTATLKEDGKIEIGKVIEDESTNDGSIQPTRYYTWSSGSVNGYLPDDASANLSDIDTKGFRMYIALDVDRDKKITSAYSCFVDNEKEYCLKGADTTAFDANIDTLKNAVEDEGNKVENSCGDFPNYFGCYVYGRETKVNSAGLVGLAAGGSAYCDIKANGDFSCDAY